MEYFFVVVSNKLTLQFVEYAVRLKYWWNASNRRHAIWLSGPTLRCITPNFASLDLLL